MSARLARALRGLLHVEGSPHRTALAFGIGVFIAFFPLLGIHTGLALLLAFGLRLSRVAMLTGAYLNNPWTLVPLYLSGTWVGCALLSVSPAGLAQVEFHGALRAAAAAVARAYLWPFVIGNLVCGLVAGALAYALLRAVLERRRAA